MAKGVKTGGRTAGTPNKATQEVREVIALFAQQNASKFAQWINDTAEGDPDKGVKPDPGKAADLYLKAIEYHIPKLGRQEHVGDGGGDIGVTFRWAE
jgi:hypothetical protein